jgi:chromosome segregation ATPase
MIELIMYISIGFLVAGLLVIGVIPMVHARAVRLTQRRLEAMTPISMAEIHADKDQLRAEFAMSTRRLEMSVEQMKAKTTSQLAELGKKSDEIGRLKIELGEKAAELLAGEAKVNAVNEELADARSELAARSEALRGAERRLGDRVDEVGKLSTRLNEHALTSDSRRVELAAAQAQVEALQGLIDTLEQEVKSLQASLDEQSDRSDTANALLAEERIKADAFRARIKELESKLVQQTNETEIFGRRAQELLARLDEHERRTAEHAQRATEHEHAAEQLRSEVAAAQRTESVLRGELAARYTSHRAELEAVGVAKAHADEEFRLTVAERDRLRGELAAVKREAEEAEEALNTERVETAVMRERINDVAAEVAGLTAALEGPGSPIETILAADAVDGHAATNGAAAENGNGIGALGNGRNKASLADRIRALQSRHARVSQAP